MDNHIKGRANMRAWLDSKPDNFFTSDNNLQHVMRRYMDDRAYLDAAGRMEQTGALAATIMDEAAMVEDRIGNHPRLERWSGIGERIEQIEFHPNHDVIGRIVWESGLLALQAEPGNLIEQMGIYYLLTHNGEGGHMCSVTCTAGVIRALQTFADDEVKARFLPPLLSNDYDTMRHAAQFLTEVQGGSDVGANSIRARDNGDGTWRISGEKWFCSNINADQFIMTARPEGADEGTRGLGLFIVPRKLADGTVNGLYLRRLKDKLGTRTLASAEVDFVDALAYPVGDLSRGFKNVVESVLNTSRLMNAVGCAAITRRAAIEAGHYACTREAFGNPIANYPMVQEAYADIVTEQYASVASCFAIADLLNRLDLGEGADDDESTYRLLVNINKYITSIRATESVHRAIEVLGGNGAIESFSILPRLYRDMVVFESWEGAHNVLCLQVLRDIARYNIHEPFYRYISGLLDAVTHDDLRDNVILVRNALKGVMNLLQQLQAGGQQYAEAHARRLVDAFAHVTQAALLLAEAQWELSNDLPTLKPDITTYFVNKHLRRGYDPMTDDSYLPRLERIMASV